MRGWATVGIVAALAAWAGAGRSLAAAEFADALAYPDDAAARAAWEPMGATAPACVERAADGKPALRLPCNFKGTRIDRASWDHPLALDLAGARAVAFDVACDDPSPIASLSFYLHSGDGWYGAHFSAASREFRTVVIDKVSTNIEGRPSGWARIDMLRLSAWRGGETDTTLHIRNLRVIKGDGAIVLVRGESAAAAAGGEVESVCVYARAVARRLDELGLGYAMMSDLDLSAERLKDAKLAVLAHNPTLPGAAAGVLAEYLGAGGKMLAFYVLPDRLQKAAGIAVGRHVVADGRFSAIRADAKNALAGMPAVTKQASWNIRQAAAVEGRSRVVAEWCDRERKPSGEAAIVASNNCVFMTHVLLDDDLANKRRLVMAMAGALVPELWRTAADASLGRIAEVGPHKDRNELERRAAAADGERARDTARQALRVEAEARALRARGLYPESMAKAEEARLLTLKGWCMLEAPAALEWRAFWCHSAFGVEGMDWDAAAAHLARNGFTALQVNMCRAGAAYYPSAVLPVAGEVKERGDQIAKCLAACRKAGIECHVWKVNWNLGGRAPADFLARLKAEGRLQKDPAGRAIAGWLCPSHPANRALEIDSMVEIATKYDVDGIHFDYIRYPGPEGCFCEGCRARFETSLGRKVARWPADAQSAELRPAWLDFRRENINAVVSAVSDAVRKAKPKLKISAAVFPNWPVDRDGVGQDWRLWCERGWVDFVCPMDYTADADEFESLVRRQLVWAGKARCYPGIGLSCWRDRDVFGVIRMIRATQAAKTGGFTVFDYDPAAAEDVVPLLGLGITRKD